MIDLLQTICIIILALGQFYQVRINSILRAQGER